MRRISLAFCLCAILTSCASASLSEKNDLEEYPLRSATDGESANLKRCLRAVEVVQKDQFEKKGEYFKKTKDLPIGRECLDFLVGLRSNGKKYEAIVQFHDNETTVRWSITDQGVIEEHMDEDDGLEF